MEGLCVAWPLLMSNKVAHATRGSSNRVTTEPLIWLPEVATITIDEATIYDGLKRRLHCHRQSNLTTSDV